MANVTQQAIADKLGIHKTTVSMALRGVSSIPEKTRKKITQTAIEMGYSPNLLARALVSGKSNTIGLLISSLQLEIASAKVVALDQIASNAGYRTYISYTKGEFQRTLEAAKELKSRGVDGLIIYGGSTETRKKHLHSLFELDIPIVFLDARIPFPCRQVYHDKAIGIKNAVNHLYKQGHREIYMIRVWWNRCETDPRFLGFASEIEHLRLGKGKDRIFELKNVKNISKMGYSLYFEKFFSHIKTFIKAHPNCTAILCSNDYIAMSVITSLEKLGINVPDDISVVGFDDIPSASYFRPPLTTIAQPVQQLVKASFDLLLESIEQKNSEPKEIIIPSEFIIRESTGKVKKIKKTETLTINKYLYAKQN